MKAFSIRLALAVAVLSMLAAAGRAETPLREQLRATPFKIAWECYVDGNWEIFVMNADGAHAMNLTRTPKVHEHYPQVSPDGTKICFSVDTGEGRQTVRSLWVMDSDGRNRRKIADHAREAFWCPDGKSVGYLAQEYLKFDPIDFFTHGMMFYDLTTDTTVPHVNSANLHHLYNPGFARKGKWIVSTVHAGMGVSHAILLIEADGKRIINLKVPGCRPCLSPDCKHIAWGAGDQELATAPLDLEAKEPAVGPWSLQIRERPPTEIYHIDWSPDGRFVAFSRGPHGDGDLNKPGTFQVANPVVGAYAAGWNICVVAATRRGVLDLNKATESEFVQLTTNGCSNKEPAWFWPNRPAGK
jgi:hypothetical protein